MATTGAQTIPIANIANSQEVILRLYIVMFFHDRSTKKILTQYEGIKDGVEKVKRENGGDELDEEFIEDVFSINSINMQVNFEEIDSKEEIIEKRVLYVDEKKLLSWKRKAEEKKLIKLINNYYTKNEYKEIRLSILIPQVHEAAFLNNLYLAAVFNKDYFEKHKKINIKESYIREMFIVNANGSDNSSYGDPRPTKVEAKIAALMSHYIYFYLDWLEYVHVHVHGLSKYQKERTTDSDILKEFKMLSEPAGGFWSFKNGLLAIGGKVKVQFRIVNRLREIAKASNYSVSSSTGDNCEKISDIRRQVITIKNDMEAYNKNKSQIEKKKNVLLKDLESLFLKGNDKNNAYIKGKIKEIMDHVEDKSKTSTQINYEIDILKNDVSAIPIYINILAECKKNGRPIGFFDLYDRFGYWDKIGDPTLKEEARKWYVSHPYIVFKNDYLDEAYNKVLKVIRRKTDQLFIPKKEKGFVYNTVLTHGMDQLSGYGGLLFTKVNDKWEAEKFAYCNKGTDVNSLNDWLFEDILQGLSGFSLQHTHAVRNGMKIDTEVRKKFPNMTLFFCGHSLGGGLASSCAIAAKGRHAITFNAAGLNFIGSLATRGVTSIIHANLEALNPWGVTNRVHPIRIEGEAIDEIMKAARIVTIGNERGYGNDPLVIKFNDTFLSEWGGKHGINNFLYKPLMDQICIVDRKTALQPQGKDKISLNDLRDDKLTFYPSDKCPMEKFIDNSAIFTIQVRQWAKDKNLFWT